MSTKYEVFVPMGNQVAYRIGASDTLEGARKIADAEKGAARVVEVVRTVVYRKDGEFADSNRPIAEALKKVFSA